MMNISDKFGRTFRTLRVSLTNSCNFGCSYCINGDSENKFKIKDNLSFTELANLVIHLNDFLQFKNVRLTGGEPTLYRDLIPFIMLLTQNGIKNISITTNGFLLKKLSEKLATAGIKEINVSLDAVEKEVFKKITNRDSLQEVLEGIQSAVRAGISIKINSVIMRSINDNQVLPLLDFAVSMNLRIRYLELMRMGHFYSKNFNEYFFSQQQILDAVKSKYLISSSYRNISATAKYWVLENGFEFGIIANESEPFCSDCDRLRIDSSGNIYGCLSENVYESITDTKLNEKILREKLVKALSHKQPLKFKGSTIRMIDIGG